MWINKNYTRSFGIFWNIYCTNYFIYDIIKNFRTATNGLVKCCFQGQQQILSTLLQIVDGNPQ